MRVRTSVKKDQIVAIAAEVFREHGFERASMAEIAERLGGSKGTLYGYFPSKEELFVAVTEAAAEQHFGSIWHDFDNAHDISEALLNLGTKFLSFVLQADVVAAHRMVLAISGQSEIGRSFYRRGPETGTKMLASILDKAIDSGRLKRADSWLMAQQLLALFEAELRPLFMFGVITDVPHIKAINAISRRAVDVFLAAYRPRERINEDANAP